MRPKFLPFLFDSRDAWERTIADPSWHRDMDFATFMRLYSHYRNGNTTTYIREAPVKAVRDSLDSIKDSSEILDQREIDLLISKMSGDTKNDATTENDIIKEIDGLLNQADLDALFNNL